MPITTGHYNVILRGHTQFEQDNINSFYYTVANEGLSGETVEDELFEIGRLVWESFQAELRVVTHLATTYHSVEVFKADGVDVGASGFYTIPEDESTGLVDGDPMPPQNCWTFQYVRPSAGLRHGWKRFGILSETSQVNNRPTSPVRTALDALAVKLRTGTDFSIGLTFYTLKPALVQRTLHGLPVDPDVWYAPSTVQYRMMGSQNSRKEGRGS